MSAQPTVIPVILAGGVGSRLWPVSRTFFPKQFHKLLGEHSFLQSTLKRAAQVTAAAPILVCNEEHRFLVAEQCREIDTPWQQLILEPEGRNSAPAIALAAEAALKADERAILLVLPSDHLVSDIAKFSAAVDAAVAGALKGGLVTFGVTPDRAETGYGYIEVEDPGAGLQCVKTFVEKPDAEVAERYLASGNYLWNSGMFVLGAANYLRELNAHSSAMAVATSTAMAEATTDMDFLRPSDAFLSSPSDSIDYAVMEKTDKAEVVPVDFGWNDIGSWSAIWDESEQDAEGNHLRGDVVAVDTTNSYVHAGERLIGTIGVDNLVVVETVDAILIADRDRVQDVKTIVNKLEATERSEHLYHREVFRPWGSYEGIADGERYQVKCIKVKPGRALQPAAASSSLRTLDRGERHRAGHARRRRLHAGREREHLHSPRREAPAGESRQAAAGADRGAGGPYLGEDDIERFDDVYGR